MTGRLALLLLAALALAALAPAALAPAAPAAAPAAPPAVFGTWSVEDSTVVRSRLAEADRLLRRGLRDQAVPLLQEILDDWPDHLVRDAKDPLQFTGAREAVHRLLRDGTPELRRAYLEFAGPRADAALERGTRTGDVATLERDGRRYAAAGAPGARLLLAAADLRLARGEPGPAADSLRVLLRVQAGEPGAGPAAAARLARALSRTGDRAAVVELRREWSAKAAAEVRVGEGTTTLGAILEEAVAAAGPAPRPSDTTMLGGAPDRRALGLPPEPLGTPRWAQGNARFSWTGTDRRQSQSETSVSESIQRAEPVAAALVDGILYYHWSLDVVARDLYTGRERWRFRAPPVVRIEMARTHGSLLTCPAVADGVVYAPLQVWPEGELPREYSFSGIDIIPHIPVRRLYALDASTGAVLWTHRDGERYGPWMRGPLRLLNLTSAPLVQGDLVVAAGAAAVQGAGFDAWCIAADRRTGEIRWATRLGSGQVELNLFGRKVKEIPSAAVASDGRRLFVQTNMGIVCCLDPATGLPLWTRGYRESEVPLYDNFWSTPERAFTWSGSPPVVAGGLVLAAPADGPDLLAIEADTGALAWTFPCRDARDWDSPHMFRLLGADDERAFVAGGPSVRAIDLRSGKKLPWEFTFPGAARGEASQGRGVLADGKLFVPSNRALYALDTRGAPSPPLRVDPYPRPEGDPRALPDGGGNLVVTEGASALVRLEGVEAFYRQEDVRVRALALLRDRPGSVDALLEAARIYLAAERPEDALPLLEQALRAVETLPPAERESRRREVRVNLSSVRERRAEALLAEGKAAEAKDAFAAAADLAPDSPASAAVLLRGALALVNLDPSRLDHAAALLARLLAEHGDATLEGDSQLLDGDSGRTTAAAYALWNLSRWKAAAGDAPGAVEAAQGILERPAGDLLFGGPARRQARDIVDNLLRAHGREIYAPFERRAAEALEGALRAGDPAAMAAIAERWPNSRAAVRGSLEEARVRLKGGDAPGVVASLRRLLAGRVEEADEAEGQWLLAEGLLRTGRAASARATLLKLARLHGGIPVPYGEERLPAAEAVARRLQSEELKAPPPPPAGLPTGSPWRELWSRPLPPGESTLLLDAPGDPLPGGKILLVRGTRLEALDAATGAPAWSIAGREYGRLAVSAAGVLVFARDDEAVGIDPSTGDELWRAGLPGTAVDARAVDSLVVILVSDDGDPDGGCLTALDPATGERAWPARCVVPGGATRIIAREGAVVWDGSGTKEPALHLFRAADGVLLPFGVPLRREGERTGETLPTRTGPLVIRKEFSVDAYDPVKGTHLWPWSPPGKVRVLSAAATAGIVAILDADPVKGGLHGIDAATGREAWFAPAGKGRRFNPLTSTLQAAGDQVYAVTVDAGSGGGVVVEARGAADGVIRWKGTVSAHQAQVEVVPSGAAVLVKYLGTGAGRTGTAVFEAAGGREIDRFEDPEGRLGADGFDGAAVSGVLVLANDRVVLARAPR